jgi:hypothetical protein
MDERVISIPSAPEPQSRTERDPLAVAAPFAAAPGLAYVPAIQAREASPSLGEAWLTARRFAFLLGLFIAATFPTVLLGTRTFNIRDYGLFSYPVAFFHRECFWRGELPLWNSFNQCGLPFLAQWNTITLYPLSLIYLLLPLPWSLSLFCLVHLFWSGLGMFILARRWTRHSLAAALAGVVFAFNGLSLNFLMWPSHIATFSWLPWVLWLGQAAWRQGGRNLLWATLAAAMQMLAGGPETIVLTWLILLLLACGDAIAGYRLKVEGCKLAHTRDWAGNFQPSTFNLQPFVRLAGLALLVALICAAQLLPFLQLLAHSQRNSGYAAASHDWAMPFWGWANFLVPLFRTSPNGQGVFLQNTQYWTSSYYAGICTLLLAVVALRRTRDWRVRLLATLCFLGLVLAWGETSFLFSLLRAGFAPLGFVPYPIKFVILVLAVTPPLAAFGFAALAGTNRLERFEWGCGFAGLGLIPVIMGTDWNASVPADVHCAVWQNGLSRGAFFGGTFLLLVLLLKSRNSSRTVFGLLLLVAVWLDLATHVPTQNPTVSPSVYAPGWANTRRGKGASPILGQSRVLVSSGARDTLARNPLRNSDENFLRNRLAGRADCNLLDALPVVDGFFSLTPREVSRVTSLPYAESGYITPALMDFVGVSHVTSPGALTEWSARPTAMPLVTAGQKPAFADDRLAFESIKDPKTDFHCVALLPPEAQSVITAAAEPNARITQTHFGGQQVGFGVEASTPSVVVIAQTYYPAWHAYVDGRPARLWRANYAFQAVEVPAGKHAVRLIYEDRAFYLGCALTGLGLLGCGGLWWATRGTRISNQ